MSEKYTEGQDSELSQPRNKHNGDLIIRLRLLKTWDGMDVRTYLSLAELTMYLEIGMKLPSSLVLEIYREGSRNDHMKDPQKGFVLDYLRRKNHGK